MIQDSDQHKEQDRGRRFKKRNILALLLIAFTATVWFVFHTENEYQATAMVHVLPQAPDRVVGANETDVMVGKSAEIEKKIAQVKSREVLSRSP